MSPIVTPEDLRELVGPRLWDETVAHTAHATGTDAAAAQRPVLECARYLYLISAHRERLAGLFLPVEQAVDEVWHYLILQTREYRDLCENRLPGGEFIHHRSISYQDYGAEPDRRQMIEEGLRWIPLYQNAFGPFDAGALQYWTMARFLVEEMRMSLDDLGALTA